MTNPMTTKELALLAEKAAAEFEGDHWFGAEHGAVAFLLKPERDFIAACTPETILALTDRVEACERDAARWRKLKEMSFRLETEEWEWDDINDFEGTEQISLEDRIDAALNAKDVT